MTYLYLFWEYFQIGLFTIGGGYAMLPLVTQAIQKHGWLTQEQLIDFIGIAESTPGPFAINLATFVGVEAGSATSLGVFGGLLGALTATLAVVLPSFLIIILVTKLFATFQENKYVQGVLYGVRPVVVGLVLSAIVTVAGAVVLPKLDFKNIQSDGFSDFNYISMIIMVAFFPLSRIKIKGKKIHPIFLILTAAVLGIVLQALDVWKYQ